MLVNDELLQRLTNGKAGLNKPLVIPRASETSVPLDYHSPPEEVTEWLQGKGFSEPWVITTTDDRPVYVGVLLFICQKVSIKGLPSFDTDSLKGNDDFLYQGILVTVRYYHDTKGGESIQWSSKGEFVPFVPQDGDMSGSADGRPALLPQQGGATSCDSRRGRQSVQPAHCAEGTVRGKLKEDDGYLLFPCVQKSKFINANNRWSRRSITESVQREERKPVEQLFYSKHRQNHECKSVY